MSNSTMDLVGYAVLRMLAGVGIVVTFAGVLATKSCADESVREMLVQRNADEFKQKYPDLTVIGKKPARIEACKGYASVFEYAAENRAHQVVRVGTCTDLQKATRFIPQ